MKNSYKEILSELKLNPNTKFIKDSKVYIMNEFIDEDDLIIMDFIQEKIKKIKDIYEMQKVLRFCIDDEILPLIYNIKTDETIFLTIKKLEKLTQTIFNINKTINKDNNIIENCNENFSFISSLKIYTTLDNYKICEIYLSGLIIHDIYRGIYE